MGKRARPLGVLLLALVFVTAAGAGPDEWERELDGEVILTTNDDTILVVRATDYWTGLPVPNASVKLFEETLHPTPGFGTPIATGEADADGWIRIPRGAIEHDTSGDWAPGDWAYVFAPGYGPDARYQSFHGEVVEMRETRDVPLAFRDPLGHAVADLGVGYLLGCGHTPDVRLTRTDAKGRARLEDIQVESFGQIWLWKEGLLSEYGPDPRWQPGDPPLSYRCQRSIVVEGTLLTPEGEPAVGVAIGTRNYHRGPWARTDESGAFRLVGTGFEPGADDLYVEPFEGRVGRTEWHTSLIFTVPPPGIRRVLRLPAPQEDDLPAFEGEPATASIAAHVEIEGELPEDVYPGVIAARLSDGLTLESGDQGDSFPLDVPPGTYVVIATLLGPAGWPGLAQARAEVTVADGGTASTRLVLPAPRVICVSGVGWPEDAALSVVTEHLEYDAGNGRGDEALSVPVPAIGEVFLRLDQDPLDRVVPVPEGAYAADAEPLVLPWIRPTTVRARFAHADGSPATGFLEVGRRRPSAYEGYFTSWTGESEVEETVLPEEGLSAWVFEKPHSRAPRRIPLPSPLPEGETIDLGTVAFAEPTPARLHVVGVDGSPEGACEVRISADGHIYETETDENGAVWEDWGPEPAVGTGATVLVASPGGEGTVLPWRASLDGPPPWRLAPPPGRIDVNVVDEAGAPYAPYSVLVDGIPLENRKERVRIAGLTLGKHDVIVTAEGCRAWHYRVILADDTPREIRCRLREIQRTDGAGEE